MAAGVECPKGTSSRFALGRPLASGGDSDETRLRYHKGPPPRPKSEPSKAGPIWKGGATKRYKVFGASPQTDAGNIVSAVCSDAVVPAAGVECPRGTSSRFALGRPLASGGDSDETRLRYHKGPPPVGRPFVVPAAGVEPARVISPTDFESVTSANSITPACAFHITISSRRLQALFRDRGNPYFRGRGEYAKGRGAVRREQPRPFTSIMSRRTPVNENTAPPLHTTFHARGPAAQWWARATIFRARGNRRIPAWGPCARNGPSHPEWGPAAWRRARCKLPFPGRPGLFLLPVRSQKSFRRYQGQLRTPRSESDPRSASDRRARKSARSRREVRNGDRRKETKLSHRCSSWRKGEWGSRKGAFSGAFS